MQPPGQCSDGVQEQVSPKRAARREHAAKQNTMNGPLYMQGSNKAVLVRRLKRQGNGPGKTFAHWFVENQTGLAFNLVALLLLTHCIISKSRYYTTKFFTLSYYNPRTERYGMGADDGYLLAFFVIILIGLRASAMEHLLAPFAKWHGMSQRKAITRFSEQGWLVMYYTFMAPLGMYLYYQSPYFLNLRNLWTGWPDREVDGVMKAYMLAQLAFWVKQAIVINVEERRKDHWQMYTHHIVTIILIFASWRYGHTRVGTLILILFDGVDLVFSTAKCLKYLSYQSICDVAFGIFMVSWIACRHVAYLMICYSIWKHTPDIMPTGCFRGPADNPEGPFQPPTDRGYAYLLEPLYDSEGIVCYNHSVKWSFLSVLLFLQAITLVWLYAIIRVATRVLMGKGSDDPRSDDEADESTGEHEYDPNADGVEYRLGDEEDLQNPIEEEVGVEDIDLKGWERRSGHKRQVATTATGVSLPGHHSDRKELLGRIGCEKQVE